MDTLPIASNLGNTPLQPFKPENIPTELRKQKRWAPWKAVWNEKRGKLDKLPCQANGYGISTAQPERWYTFDHALAAQQAQHSVFAGIGYVMTGVHGIVGVDLDRCVDDAGVVSDQAQAIVDALGGYAERSPSGHGLRIMAHGGIPADWTNHDIGIEVYAGHAPRFLTITGDRLPDAAPEVRPAPAGVLEGLSQRYARERTVATDISRALPDILDDLSLPDLADLELPYEVKDFLSEGDLGGKDRSTLLLACAVALRGNGLSKQETFSFLANNEHAFGAAAEKRGGDPDRGLMLLWVEYSQKIEDRGSSRVATLADFDDVSGGKKPAPASAAHRFNIQQAGAFSRGKPMEWAIKNLIPSADLGVIYGESGAGKSFFTLDLVLCLVTGRPWRDRRVKQGAVLYICAEGAGGFRARLRALAGFHGLDLDTLPFYVLGDSPNMLDKQDVTALVSAARAVGAEFKTIIVDTLAQVTAGGNENSGEDMGRALGNCRVLGAALGAMTLLVAHSGKDASRGVRGWSGIKGALDVEILVEKAGAYRAATVTKMKDGQGEGDEHGFDLQSVVLGQNEDGEDITSCVVTSTATVPKAQRKAEPKGVWQQTALRVAQGLTDLPGDVSHTQLIDAAVNEMPAEIGRRDRRREQTMRAIEALVAANRLSLSGGLVNVL